MKKYNNPTSLDEQLAKLDTESKWIQKDQEIVLNNILTELKGRDKKLGRKRGFKIPAMIVSFCICLFIGGLYLHESNFLQNFLSEERNTGSGEEQEGKKVNEPKDEIKTADNLIQQPIIEIEIDSANYKNTLRKLENEEFTDVENVIKNTFKTSIEISESFLDGEYPPSIVTITQEDGKEMTFHFWTNFIVEGDKLTFQGMFQDTITKKYYQMKENEARWFYAHFEQYFNNPLLHSALITDITFDEGIVLSLQPATLIWDESAPNGHILETEDAVISKKINEQAYFYMIDLNKMVMQEVRVNELNSFTTFFIEYFENENGEVEFAREYFIP